MRGDKIVFVFLALFMVSSFSRPLKAESVDTERLFKDVFITAGYTALLGGLLGTSAMFMSSDPLSTHIRWVGVGASLGFFGGTILGSYLAFGPLFLAQNSPALINIADNKFQLRFPTVTALFPPGFAKNQALAYYGKLLHFSF